MIGALAAGPKPGRKPKRFIALAALAALVVAACPADRATSAPNSAGVRQIGPSGLPVPRFVSLKSSRVNVRVGPGENYGISWVFVKPGLPIEVVQEYDNWRRIRDSDGSMGWVFQSLLSGKRNAVVAPWAGGDPRPIRRSAAAESAIVAYLEPGVMGKVERCANGWCRISGSGYAGWIDREQLWGVYPDEDID
jgi:SH3-like domain-containing protein